jgi:hypothetical protein
MMLLSQIKTFSSYMSHSEHIEEMPSEKEKHLTGSSYCLSFGRSSLVCFFAMKQAMTTLFRYFVHEQSCH